VVPAADDARDKQVRDLLRQAIDDLQGSIRANDAKAAAALVVHGLLFAGVLTVIREVKPVYREALDAQRLVMVVLLAVALAAFVYSVLKLAQAVRPYVPKALRDRIAYAHPGVFFPISPTLSTQATAHGTDELKLFLAKLAPLTPAQLLDEYAAEVVKLAAIREYEVTCATRGYVALGIEVGLVTTWLVVVATIALTQL
jgi:hypothetical protein